VGAYVVGWLQGGVGDGAAFAFMAAALFLASILMFLVTEHGRRGAARSVAPPPVRRLAPGEG